MSNLKSPNVKKILSEIHNHKDNSGHSLDYCTLNSYWNTNMQSSQGNDCTNIQVSVYQKLAVHLKYFIHLTFKTSNHTFFSIYLFICLYIVFLAMDSGSMDISSEQERFSRLRTDYHQQQLQIEEETAASWDVLQQVSKINYHWKIVQIQ